MEQAVITTVEEYIRQFPIDIQKLLLELRQAVREIAPEAEEKISYRMPAYFQNGVLVYFAAFKRHVGFYPAASGIEAFKGELSEYKSSKGAVQFPIDKLLPIELIKKIVKFRLDENTNKV